MISYDFFFTPFCTGYLQKEEMGQIDRTDEQFLFPTYLSISHPQLLRNTLAPR